MNGYFPTCIVAAGILALSAAAQPPAAATLDAATRSQVIDAALEALDKSYVFPEVAGRMAADVRRRDRAGEYAIDDPEAFARKLTADLQSVSRDLHLRVRYSTDDRVRPLRPRPVNFGFEKVERLPGNIGYLELTSFMGAGREAEQAADAAMAQLASSDALIVDLRRNGGGSPHMVARVSSHLFESRTHLNSLYWREGDRTEEFWTADLPGPRFGQSKPVYVLTSKSTFSGAEEFAYNLKSRKRATIVGETTGGGAHPGAIRRLAGNFTMFVPTGRAINPVTRTNWEGTGVAPDVVAASDDALERALELARKAISR